MATYLELRNLFNDGDLKNKVITATVVAAKELLGGTPTANDRAWASSVLANPKGESSKALMTVLAENKALDVSAIQGATDAGIQAQVDSVVPQLVLAMAGA